MSKDNPRIAVLGFAIECNRFSPVTTAADFQQDVDIRGNQIVSEARSGASITLEANKLAAGGILEKRSDPADGRRVLLKCTARGQTLLERMAPYQRRINDVLFERLDARRFAQVRALARELVTSGDRAVAMLDFLLHEAKAA